jgi:hypothetical protein
MEWARTAGTIQGLGRLDKGSIYRLWKQFDRFVAEARVDPDQRARYAALAAVTGASAEIPPSLPPFGEVVGLLHAHCYDERAVVASLGGAAAVAERVGCARRWLAGPGRQHCWIDQRADGDVTDARSLLADGAMCGPLTPEQREALFAAVFGTAGGPPTKAIMGVFGPALLRCSLETYLRDGTRPLRDRILDALDPNVPLSELVGP